MSCSTGDGEEYQYYSWEVQHRSYVDAVGNAEYRQSAEQRFLAAQRAVIRDEQERLLREASALLTVKQREIVSARYWQNEPRAAIGRRLGVLGEAVRKQEGTALQTLKARLLPEPAFEAYRR
jgi:DNA-directed RNA polymerase specialized sigma24 family protein